MAGNRSAESPSDSVCKPPCKLKEWSRSIVERLRSFRKCRHALLETLKLRRERKAVLILADTGDGLRSNAFSAPKHLPVSKPSRGNNLVLCFLGRILEHELRPCFARYRMI